MYVRVLRCASLVSLPCRHFSKRLGSGGFVGGGELRAQQTRRKQPAAAAGGAGGGAGGSSGGGAGESAAAAGGQQRAAGGVSDSIAALEAENEERLSPFMLPIITARPPSESDLLSSEHQVAEWQYERAVRRRVRAQFIRQNLQLSGKLRRRWEAINGLTDELRRVCMREDRTPLPASIAIPLQANGQPLLPTTPGLAGAEPWTERELKQHLDWQQKQKERGLPY